MSNVRLIIIVFLLPAVIAVMSGQESPTQVPGLRTSTLHADTLTPYSIIPIRATDNGSYSEVDTFGVHPAATYCIDGELEPWLVEIPFPPRPPEGVFDFRFTEHRTGSTCMFTGLKVDMQEPGKLDTFRLEFQPGEGGYPMRLSWKDAAARIAADWETLVIKDGFGGLLGVNLDMKVDTAVDIPAPLPTPLFIIGRSIIPGTRYRIDATAGVGGAILPGGSVYVDAGGSQSFTITPSAGHSIEAVVVDGVNAGAVGGYTFTDINADHMIHATFTANQYQITATAGPGGTISPGGTVGVTAGGNQTFLIQASPGYRTVDVMIDGVSSGPRAQYSFTNVTANHTIHVTFTANQFTITASAGTGGTISPAGTVGVPAGGNQTFLVQASPGYQIDDVMVDGVSSGPRAQYSFTNVTANHTIQATFTAIQFTITSSAGPGGSISPKGTIRVPAGGNQTFFVQASPGYQTDNVIVDDVSYGPVAQYPFTNVGANHIISAWFKPIGGGVGSSIVPITGRDAGTGTGAGAFGVHPNATYCLDGQVVPGLVEGELPPRPPAGSFDLRFTEHRSGSSCLGTGTKIHMQEPGKLDTFKIEVQPGTAGYPVTLSWPGGLGSTWTSLTMRDIFGGSVMSVNMLSRSSVVVTNPLLNSFFIIGKGGPRGRTYSINASAGPQGSIAPQGFVTVDSGDNQSFTPIPDPGFVVDSISVDGARVIQTSSYTFLNVTADHSIRVDFRPGTRSGYRTFTAADLAIRTPVKKKPLYHRFSFRLINSSPQTATELRINFAGSASTLIQIDRSTPFTSATTVDGKEWNFAGGEAAPGDTVLISGTTLGRPLSVHRWNWIYHGLTGEPQGRFVPPGQRAAYPMPNSANIREELFLGGFASEGLTVGIPRNDSARYYGWIRMVRGSQLQRSLVQRSRVHAGVARCFDFVNQKRTLAPGTQDNVMFANQAALKFNLRLSLLGVTPVGLRSLVFQDTVPNPLDGMTVGRIAEYADSLLSGYYVGSVHLCESVTLLGQVNGSIERINAAFAGPMDTVAYASGTFLAGVREVVEVSFLRASPEIDTMAVEWYRGGPAASPPSELTLLGNYPNPFNPTTTIRFSLPADAFVSAVVYNQLGQQVALLDDNEFLTEGEQEIDFDGSALGSGLYFCRISIVTAEDTGEDRGTGPLSETAVVRMLLVK